MDVVGGRATPGGGPFNTARTLGRLGVPAAFVGHLSDDAHGRVLLDALQTAGVNLDLASIGPEKTTIALAHVEGGAARYEFFVEATSAPQLTREMLPPRLPASIGAIHFGSLGLVLEPMATTLLDLVASGREGRVVMLDPNVRPGLIPDASYRETLQRAVALSTIVKASEEDLTWLDSPVDVRLMVVTRGRAGAFALHGGERVDVPAVEVDVHDTIGAGDAFGAGLLAWLSDHGRLAADLTLDREELAAALEFACGVAARELSSRR